jgi:hypothetical protein
MVLVLLDAPAPNQIDFLTLTPVVPVLWYSPNLIVVCLVDVQPIGVPS